MLSGGYGNQVILSCRNGYSTDGYRRNGYSGSVPLEKVASHFKGTWQPTELEVCLGEDATEAKTTLKWMSRNAAASLERLTLLPPTSMSMSDEDCKMFGFHLQQLPHLRILRVDRPDEYWLPLDNRFIDPESRLLSSIVRKCSVLRYIKVGQFAWRVDRGMQGRVAILQAMDPTEQQDIELFQSGAEQDEYVQYNPLRCPVWAPTPHLAPTGLDGEFEETLEYEPLVGIALEKLSEWCTEQAQTLIPASQRRYDLLGGFWMDSKLQKEVAQEIANAKGINGIWQLRFSTIDELEMYVPRIAEWEYRHDRGGGEALVQFCAESSERIHKRWEDANWF